MLSAARRVGVSTGAKLIRGPAKFSFSTFQDREKGEEAKYIRAEEEKLRASRRAEMERILALEDHHAEKQNLVGILGKS